MEIKIYKFIRILILLIFINTGNIFSQEVVKQINFNNHQSFDKSQLLEQGYNLSGKNINNSSKYFVVKMPEKIKIPVFYKSGGKKITIQDAVVLNDKKTVLIPEGLVNDSGNKGGFAVGGYDSD